MMEISFLYPKLLLFLLFIPFFVLTYFLSTIYNKKKSLMFPNFDAVSRISGMEFFSRNFLSLYLNIIILCLIVFAMAGTNVVFRTNTSSFSYIFAIDNSDSMAALDIFPNRLEAAKSFAKSFVDKLPLVEIGVIAFSGDAVVFQELGTSKLKSKMAIDNVDFGDVQGTNVYNALVVATRLFGTKNYKSVILVSDGQLNIESIEKVLLYAQRRNIVVHTIAVGTLEGGATNFETISKVDQDFLKSLAFNTGGKFFSVQDEEGFDEVSLELSEQTTNLVSLDVSIYLIVAALILFAISWVLFNFRFRTLP